MLSDADKVITYRHLAAWIASLSERKKDLPVHIAAWPHAGDAPVRLDNVYLLATVEEATEGDPEARTRSHVDNDHHPGLPVIWSDRNPFGEDGARTTDLMTGERIFPRYVEKLEVQ